LKEEQKMVIIRVVQILTRQNEEQSDAQGDSKERICGGKTDEMTFGGLGPRQVL
jgi:hypothetical protein